MSPQQTRQISKSILIFDACQVGVVLRTVLVVQAVLAVAVMFFETSFIAWGEKLALVTGGALPGTYKVGAWYNRSNATDVGTDDRAQAGFSGELTQLRRSGRYGVYLQFQQQLTGSARQSPDGRVTDHGLVAFLNITQADRLTSVTDNQIAAGLSYTGLIPARPRDKFGFAVGRTNVNTRATVATPGTTPGRLDAEYVAEAGYGIHLSDWLTLRPNIQYIHNPGGDRSADDVIVIGLRGAFTI